MKSVTSADRETWDVRFRRVGSSDSVAEVNAVTREGYAVSPKYVSLYTDIPYRMKIYTEFNLATWLRLVKFMEINISEF